jgi:TldD protein
MMDLDKIRKSLSEKSFFCDFRSTSKSVRVVGIKDGEPELKESREEGIAVRTFTNGSWGFASGAPQDFDSLLSRAEKLARAGRGNSRYPERKGESPSSPKTYSPPASPPEELLSECKELYSEMEDERITNRQLRLSELCFTRSYANSSGSSFTEESPLLFSRFSCIGKEGSIKQEGHHTWGSRKKWESDSLFSSAREAKRKCLDSLSSSPPPHGTFTAILDPEMAGVFAHEAVGHACEADAIMEGTSILAGKKGEKIGSGLITIMDSPEVEGGFGSYSLDDEGMPGKAQKLVSNGTLSGFLHSSETSFTLNEPPNGHARSQDFSFPPIVRMSNTYIEPGDHSPEELFQIAEGIYVKGMNGGSVDTITGQFMFRAEEAFRVSKGEPGERIRDLSITGTITGTLNEVDAIGKDFQLKPGFCGKNGQRMNVSDGGPHVRIRSIRVG